MRLGKNHLTAYLVENLYKENKQCFVLLFVKTNNIRVTELKKYGDGKENWRLLSLFEADVHYVGITKTLLLLLFIILIQIKKISN
ncbi:hypothetical protein CO024_02200 [Candidatus Gracilibacteria bacterium CG_4_9_14_0_2_um_filter_38_7]|nr:MAG: hypothetical protein AUJ87_01995 [Candidatus Gracilibacteria bacterium CG1_02_38_174]PIQ11781.1 MAG: hypothetical protein COW68_01855 [Candidatus Gracilibacteria bacterium CG18_big_fil_WC_8_21_14_2_50_38_16]PIQ41394.1 MAG: hypothetical protein COW06_03010 [Candidatus Gracilibacteria bacterium CG12_big_fil_rev_8_21_14_0_65_38_15]PIZ01411.1 MAG: hypothetical protein COY60_03650 [Candidatus Gracilibacteria bacterium CG_4_10_14_0_8_um_filter_38_28]PJC56595.1 MAG: hypothetical protein CO024_